MDENYKIEGGIDFNSELLKAICDESDEETDEPRCLITYLKLTKDHIKLSCNHSFNYEPLYLDIIRQKNPKFNRMEHMRLTPNSFRCPYCRYVHNKLIPFKKCNDSIKQIHGVNYPEHWTMKLYKCQYKFKSGKRKGLECCKGTNEKYCKQHDTILKKKAEKEMQNEVVGNFPSCCAVLISGKRKGQVCGCKKIYTNSGLCKRHFDKYVINTDGLIHV